ncbi:MAG: mevalonate kinase family protein [Rhodanobacteraceae bacterium]
MRVTASAPGKLVLLGEYAVLVGAPALVLAVNRRAHATLTAIQGDHWEIVSPTLGLEARLTLRETGAGWDGAAPHELAWVAMLLERSRQAAGLPAYRVELDSDAFYIDHAGGRVKLGLGSSAALSVALLGGLRACAERATPTLDECIRAHRAIQHGRGSGIDVAAAFMGGLSRYELAGESARCSPARLPEDLAWRCIYSGRPASTGAMLAAVAAWRRREPASFARCTRELATISSRGVDAVATNDAAAFLSSLHDYARALAAFGDTAGVDIASREHRAISVIARSGGCVYKSCGAGGGDVGVTFAVEDKRVRDVCARVDRAGFPVIALEADPQGLVVAATA